MAEEEVAPVSPLSSDHKRKRDDLAKEAPNEVSTSPVPENGEKQNENTIETTNGVEKNEMTENHLSELLDVKKSSDMSENDESDSLDVKRPRVDDKTDDPEVINEVQNPGPPLVTDVEQTPVTTCEENQIEVVQPGDNSLDEQVQPCDVPLQEQQLQVGDNSSVQPWKQTTSMVPVSKSSETSRKIEVPNDKVGVLIGKAGDTIRYIQYNSGARIQITKDAEANPRLSTRPVELIGTAESIDKAEQLIRDVISEAEAGGSPSLVARGFVTLQSGAEQVQIQVPNEKVGLIIGKGGETIRNLQTRSGARIQLIPQQLPEGDISKERTVRVTGNKRQIDAAKEMIKEVMDQTFRTQPPTDGYAQQGSRSRGSFPPSQRGGRGVHPNQPTGYDQHQRGPYPHQTGQNQAQGFQYPETYGTAPSYSHQQAPRSHLSSGWDQRSPVPGSGAPPQTGGYNSYGPRGGSSSTAPPHVNYNYGQEPGQGYNQGTGYSQSMPPQNYGKGYSDQKYENQPTIQPNQPSYGGQQYGPSQNGSYPPQGSQSGYPQQPFGKPPSQPYAPPRTAQVVDSSFPQPGPQAPNGPPGGHQFSAYPYSGAPTQSYPYGPLSVTTEGYTQPPPSIGSAPVYGQQSGQSTPGYGQQPTTGYVQQGAAYGQYPASQPGYVEQSIPNTTNYGYQGSTDAGYNTAPTSYNTAPPSGYAGYPQPTPNQASYDQSTLQPGYGINNTNAQVGYVSQQSGYGQY